MRTRTRTTTTAMPAPTLPAVLSGRPSRARTWLLLASSLASAATAASSEPRCLPPSDLSYVGEGKSLTLEQNDWLGHAVTTRTAALLLREVLGFNVSVAETPMAWSDPENDPLSRLGDGTVDANLEGWEIDWPGAEMTDYVVKEGSVETSIHEFQGRVGAYLPRYVVDDNPEMFPDYWRAFTQPEVLDLFRWTGSDADDLAAKSAAWAGNCADAYGCADGTGMWQPEWCAEVEGTPDACIPFFHVYPEYAVGWIEQLVTNLQLNISVYYAGWDLYEVIPELGAERRPLLFYSWRPHELLARNEYVRISFPERNHICEAADTDDRFGGRDCDHEGQPVFKLTHRGLESRSAAAHEFIHKRYSLRLEDQYALLAELEAGGHGGNLTVEEAACQWAKNNEERWTAWARAVAVEPPPCSEISADQIGMFPTSQIEEIRSRCFTTKEDSTAWLVTYAAPILGGIAGALLLGTLVFLARRQYKRYVNALRAEAVALAGRKERVKKAIESTFEMRYSFCVVRFDKFKEMGGMRRHESTRDKNDVLTILDTWEDAVNFAQNNPVVFLSHQWLGLAEPDPNNVQYDAILVAARQLCEQEGIEHSDLYLWCDYHSIPQANRVMQQASIATISVYAACCKYFIAIVPPSTHTESGVVCDGASYSGRGWCRVEQVAYILIHGPDRAYNCDKELQALSGDWVHDAVNVYEGNFSCDGDKELLVDVMLGVFGLALLTGDDTISDSTYGSLIQRIITHKDRVFPKEFFGDLIPLLESEVDEARDKFSASMKKQPVDGFADDEKDLEEEKAAAAKKPMFGMHGMHGVHRRASLAAGIEKDETHISSSDYAQMLRARMAFSLITGHKLTGKEYEHLSDRLLRRMSSRRSSSSWVVDGDQASVATTALHA